MGRQGARHCARRQPPRNMVRIAIADADFSEGHMENPIVSTCPAGAPRRACTVAFLLFGVLGSELSAQPLPPRWKGTIDLTIGGANATDGTEFGRISGLAVDATGRVYVADQQDNQIRMFGANGVLAAKIGRMGSGPMEFKRLATIGFGPDGRLWTRDEGNARMQILDASTTPAKSTRTVTLSNFTGGSRLPITFETNGDMVDESIYFDPTLKTFRPVRNARNSDGKITRADTLVAPPGAFDGMHKVMQPQKDAAGKVNGMAERFYWQPFGPAWIRAYGPSGLRADAVTSRYVVNVYDANGKLLRTLTRTVPKVALSAAERRLGDSLVKASEVKLPFGVPAAKPPLVAMYWSLDGDLWVERTVADGKPREADVYDANGRWIAIVEWPATLEMQYGLPVVRGRTVHMVAEDADDMQRVVRLQFR